MLHRNIPLCYVMWNLFTVGSLQFPYDNTTASMKANQNRPKIKNCVNKYIKFLYFVYNKNLIL